MGLLQVRPWHRLFLLAKVRSFCSLIDTLQCTVKKVLVLRGQLLNNDFKIMQ